MRNQEKNNAAGGLGLLLMQEQLKSVALLAHGLSLCTPLQKSSAVGAASLHHFDLPVLAHDCDHTCWTEVGYLKNIKRFMKKMSVFPKIILRAEVEDYLRNTIFKNKELLASVGMQEAERKFENLLSQLSHPPAFTTVRVNTLLAPVEQVKQLLVEEIHKGNITHRSGLVWLDSRKGNYLQFDGLNVPVLQHPRLLDVLLIPVIGPRRNLEKHSSHVIVDVQCGNAVLRGAHVYAPGILSTPKFMKAGDVVSVYSDVERKCKRGAREFWGTKVYVGNGIAELSRSEIFSSGSPLKGMGVRMTEPVYLSPSFDKMLPGYLFLQNLPSAAVSHVMNPRPGERILDMCAAPGGKTTHLATLMYDQGEVIAMDKIASKVEKIKHSAELLKINCIKAICYDGTKALAVDRIDGSKEGPPFLPESFDRILLDAPCSGMGQRPSMCCAWTLKEVTSYPPLQRKLFSVAVKLLKPGGVLVYSTCTEPHIGGEGMMGAGLSTDQLKLLQRFDPSSATLQGVDINPPNYPGTEDMIQLANKDSIGFFIAKFCKKKKKLADMVLGK
ncbi:putative methyltransferase NSUN6 isoform X3 [Rhinatrema bivittatum]|uniref:putative methyltransferase NSUN6 isoform X3 n=1 Tax=Rhinatrema bivittatum TaxID=194408 RepID=UPI001129F6AF|nr:putative methyltransferase NSUN6 isoform X3 [Rhinatrema bivittatum]